MSWTRPARSPSRQREISAAINAPKASGLPGLGTAPSDASAISCCTLRQGEATGTISTLGTRATRAEPAARARPLVDDHRLTQGQRQAWRQRTGQGVGAAAGGEGHDQADGPVDLGPQAGAGGGQCEGQL